MNINQESQTVRERLVLIVYAFYTAAMIVVATIFQWGEWVAPVILLGLAGCIMLYFRRYRTYEFRACVTTLMMWMNFSIYLMKSDDFTGAFSTMVAMIVLLAIYCVPKLAYIGAVVYTLHLIYHLLLLRDIAIRFNQAGIQDILRIGSVYVALYVTYQLVKTQVESNGVMLANIETVKNAEQSKDDFMANMSHEIRTPINTVCGISEMVLREDLPEQAREGIYDIQTAGSFCRW